MVPLSTARRKLFGRIPAQARAIWVITVKLRQGEDRAEAERQIRDLLRQRHRLQLDSEDDFEVGNPYDAIQAQKDHEHHAGLGERARAADGGRPGGGTFSPNSWSRPSRYR
jgi:hypothetical protein